MNVDILDEVKIKMPNNAELCFHKAKYNFADGAQVGYRFMWRDDKGHLSTDRGQAIIPDKKNLFQLLSLAAKDGWF